MDKTSHIDRFSLPFANQGLLSQDFDELTQLLGQRLYRRCDRKR